MPECTKEALANLCPRCERNEKQEIHPCPFDCEINPDNIRMCDCCEECTQMCRDDI